jgi:DNA (cytosine-5)-methyltransferase 1
MWPTARSEDSESCGNHPGATDSLTGATRNWPTPGSLEGGGGKSTHPESGGESFATAVKNWPTPQQHDKQGSKTPEQIAAMREKNGAGVSNLNEVAEYWPTPNVPNGGRTTSTSNYAEDGSKRQIELGAIAAIWRTPNANMIEPKSSVVKLEGRKPSDPQVGLADQVDNWQTPGTDSFRSRGGDRKDEMGLDQQARMFWGTPQAHERTFDPRDVDHGVQLANQVDNWKTPTARDWKSETGMDAADYRYRLSQQVYLLSHQDPVIPDGPPSSESAQTSHRRLNPRFVEWLMGFPISWTELCPTAPKDSADSAMPSSRTARSGSAKRSSSSKA